MKSARLSALAATLLACTPAFAESPLPAAQPEKAGMSRERLQLITSTFKSEIDRNQIPGVVIAVARRGQLVYFEALGHRDAATKTAMTPDSLFSIASMTKPMVSIAIMQLHDEGKLFLADPIGKHLPEMAGRKVGVVKDGTLETVAAVRQPTVQDLLRHTSGVTYGGRGETPVHKMWPTSSAVSSTTYTSQEFLETIAKAPLLYQPGTQWDYSLSTDVLGLIVEKVSGKPLATYLQERIWGPLGMNDTSFAIPDAKKSRLALAYPTDPRNGNSQFVLHAWKPLKFDCGGGCAASTAVDYVRFGQMLVNGGVLGDKRIIAPRTLAMMTSDQLGPEVRARTTSPVLSAGYTFGLGFAVRNGIATTAGSIGDYNWGGAYGTYFWVDPKEQLTAVLMAATPGEIRGQTRDVLRNLVMQAIVD